MKIQVSASGGSRTLSKYVIHQELKEARRNDESARLIELAPRIEKMARATIGSAFVRLDRHPTSKTLSLRVIPGTAAEQKDDLKFRFRALIGWIQLFDAEPA